MTTLRVVLDQVIVPGAGEAKRYAIELTRELMATAPDGVDVHGLVSASTAAQYEQLESSLPGLSNLQKSAFSYESVRFLWRHGLGLPQSGLTHAPGLLAPLGRARNAHPQKSQTIVTVHDSLAWTSPRTLPATVVGWRRAMLKRAERFADAIVVPNHSVAHDIAEEGSFGDRIRVIPGGFSVDLLPPADAEVRAAALGLPERYLLAWSAGSSHRMLIPLLRSLKRTDGPKVPLVILGPADIADVVTEAQLDPDRVIIIEPEAAADHATILANAEALVQPGPADGFGLQLINAMAAGVPVVHPDDPSLEEVTADAALVISRTDIAGYTASLGQHLDALLDDRQTLDRLSVAGQDRARQFSWRDSAERVWQLHADL